MIFKHVYQEEKKEKKEGGLTFTWNPHSNQIELHLKNSQESEGLFYLASSRLEFYKESAPGH